MPNVPVKLHDGRTIVLPLPDGLTPDQMGEVIRKHPMVQADAAAAAPHPNDLLVQAAHTLPTVLGGAGALLGAVPGLAAGPAGAFGTGTAGAIGGGMAGKALEQMALEALGEQAAPQTAGEGLQRASDQATSGLAQGGLNAAGHGAAQAAGWLGKGLMSMALRSSPEVAQTAIDEGITANPVGLKMLMKKLGQAGAETKRLLRLAGDQGERFHPTEVLLGAENKLAPAVPNHAVMDMGAGSLHEVGPGVDATQKLREQFLEEHPGIMTPMELHRVRQEADEIATPIWNKIRKKEPIDAIEANRYKFYKAIGDQAREMLYPIAGSSIDRERSLIAVKEGLFPTVKRGLPMVASIAGRSVPSAIAGTVGTLIPGTPSQRVERGIAGAVAGSPQGLSVEAQALANPYTLGLLRNAPRLLQLMMMASPEEQRMETAQQ